MDIRIGFIGTGFMGSPMIKSISQSGIIPASNLNIYDISKEKTQALQNELGVNALDKAEEVVDKSDIIILAVKPQFVKDVLESCKGKFTGEKILVSIAAGLPIKAYKDIIGNDKKVVRTMPNQPVLVGEGMTLVSFDENIGIEEKNNIIMIFECMGKVEQLDEKLMSEVIALTGSSPAYVFMFIEAMADAAVASGIPRQMAYRLASQAVLGSAKMVLDTGKHPGELKDQVCSPAGTTIDAVTTLEKKGFRYAVIDAMGECTRRAKEIGKIYG